MATDQQIATFMAVLEELQQLKTGVAEGHRTIWKINVDPAEHQMSVSSYDVRRLLAAIAQTTSELLEAGVIEPIVETAGEGQEYVPSHEVLGALKNAYVGPRPESGSSARARAAWPWRDLHGDRRDIGQAMAEELDGYLGNLADRARSRGGREYLLVQDGVPAESVRRDLVRRLELEEGKASEAWKRLSDEWMTLAKGEHRFSWGRLVCHGNDVLVVNDPQVIRPQTPAPEPLSTMP